MKQIASTGCKVARTFVGTSAIGLLQSHHLSFSMESKFDVIIQPSHSKVVS